MSELLSHLTCLLTTTFTLLGIFKLVETIGLKIWETIALACQMLFNIQ